MSKERPDLTPESILELLEEIRDRLEVVEEKLDYLADNPRPAHFPNHSPDSNLNDY